MDKSFRFMSMGSGSSGNCYYVGTDEYGFLIDAGVSVRTIKHALKLHNIPLEHIWGVFITHDHTDHIRSVGTLGEKHHLPVYSTKEVHDGINKNYKITEKLNTSRKYLQKGVRLVIRDFEFQAFNVSHDATDSMGFSIIYKGQRMVIATDLGFISKEVADHIAKANYLVIEANYDDTMLKNGPYPYPLKKRVSSHTGHLCNDHTARFLADNWHDELTHVFLCHLSKDNNTPQLAQDTVLNALKAKGIEPQLLMPLPRTEVTQMFVFDKK